MKENNTYSKQPSKHDQAGKFGEKTVSGFNGRGIRFKNLGGQEKSHPR